MKKIIFSFLFIILLSVINFEDVSASQFSEKIWSVKMNMDILNTDENLSNVVLLNEKGEIVEAKVEVGEQNNIMEIYPTEPYILGSYTLLIKQGFEAANSIKLKKDYKYNFSIVKTFSDINILGKWKTAYTYEGNYYDIMADFKKDFADISFPVSPDAIFTANKQVYNIDKSNMELFVSEGKKELHLSGRILLYSENKFRILTKSGNTAVFEKIK